MKAAVVRGPGQPPVYAEMPAPAAGKDEVVVRVTAAALSQVARSRASGTHYSSSGRFPFVPGVDGVGRLKDGRRVCFMLPSAPNGAMAEETVVAKSHLVPVPHALDDVTAAAIANPGVSSWAALSERAKLRRGETVLVNGATGIAGRLAVQIARLLGAKRVIATGRRAEALAELGADLTIVLDDDRAAMEDRFKAAFAGRVDVVIDYLWGTSAETMIIAAAKAAPEGVPLRIVQIGAASGQEIALHSAVLRSSSIQLMGSGLGSVPPARFRACVAALLKAAVPAGLKIATRPVSLAEIGHYWNAPDDGRRIVFVTG